MSALMTIAELLIIYKDDLHLESKSSQAANNIVALTLTALTRYVVPGWDESLTPSGRKPTKQEKKATQSLLENTSVKALTNALEVQEIVFDKTNAPQSSRNTYKSKLESLINYATKKGFLHSSGKNKQLVRSPRMRENGCIPRTTSRKRLPGYGLTSHPVWKMINKVDSDPNNNLWEHCKIPDDVELAKIPLIVENLTKLNSETQEFFKFLNKLRYPGRSCEAVSLATATEKIEIILRILGWYILYRGVKIEEISLEHLVPRVLSDEPEESKNIAEYLEEWLCDFLDFLEQERNCNGQTFNQVLKALQSLIKYRYLRVSKDSCYSNIPAMKVISYYFKEAKSKTEGVQYITYGNIEKKWLDLPEVITKIVEPLRYRCASKTNAGNNKSKRAIANSFQKYILLALFTYRPPRRQQEFRLMKTSLSCELSQKPVKLPPGGFIHPLPFNYQSEKEYGYLYKKEDGKWYKFTPSESYKTGATYKDQDLEILNLELPDSYQFYDYLEAYLYGYYLNKHGHWISAGKQLHPPSSQWKPCSLRLALDPKDNHNFVFLRPKESDPFDTASYLAEFFKRACHSVSKKILTPHLLRNITVTHFLDDPNTPHQELSSLAHYLGHSEKTLKNHYDKRSPQQKNRPIEERMGNLVQQLINGQETSQKQEISKEKLLEVLTPEQRKQLGLD
jgi:hypothetical protein